MSETPLTDTVEHSYTYPGKGDIDKVFEAMRQLERELTGAKEKIVRLENEIIRLAKERVI